MAFWHRTFAEINLKISFQPAKFTRIHILLIAFLIIENRSFQLMIYKKFCFFFRFDLKTFLKWTKVKLLASLKSPK